MVDLKREKNFYKGFSLKKLRKEKLLENVDLAIGLAKYSYRFGKHELAQDFDVLSLSNGEVAVFLAEMFIDNKFRISNWVLTEAARDPKVRKLCDGRVGVLVDEEKRRRKEMKKACISF